MRAILVFVGTALYLGLAIYGEGGFAAFFAQPAFVALSIVLFAMAVASVFTSGGIRTGEREDRSNRWVLIPFTVIGLAIGFVPAYTDRVGFLVVDGDSLRWLGVALFAIGGLLRLWPVYILGDRFSGLVAIQPGHRLVTTGIYGVIRHPSYAGVLFFTVGWSLAFRSIAGLILAALLVPALLARIRSEEALLVSHFGAEYEAYRSHTWRLIPWVY